MTAVARAHPGAWTLLIALAGALSVANAAWMLADPARWYHDLPAGVPDFGPLNFHFVRDIGVAYATAGAALLWAVWRPALRFPLVAVAALFYGGHAVVHVHDMLAGAVDAHHWLLDLPGVYLPAALLVAAAFASAPPRGGDR